MSVASILSALRECESDQNNNLIDVLAVVKSSRSSPKDSHVASIVRGLCTQNTKLLALVSAGIAEVAADPDSAIDIFKLFANAFILWFDNGFVVFEKYLACFPIEGDVAVLKKTLLHCGCYPAFADSAIGVIRNPFVVDKLKECKARTQALLLKFADYSNQLKLNNVSFDRICAISGDNVSCYFNLNQVVERTCNEPLYWGSKKVEFLLLNLHNNVEAAANALPYNALAVVSVPEDDGPRYVLFPPFRINELSMAHEKNLIKFSTTSLFDEAPEEPQSFTVEAREELLLIWFAKLARLFPTTAKLVSSNDIKLEGLGINTVSDLSEGETTQESQSECSTPSDEGERLPRRGSFEIMKKTLSRDGIATTQQGNLLEVVEVTQPRNSVRGDIQYADDESAFDENSSSDDCPNGFEMVTPVAAAKRQQATASLPDLTVIMQPPKLVYMNAAGSAIDIKNFGKSHNPSFTSTDDLSQGGASKVKVEGSTRNRQSSFFGLFRKNKSKDVDAGETDVRGNKPKAEKKPETKEISKPRVESSVRQQDAYTEKPKTEQEPQIHRKADLVQKHPELTIEIPKIGGGHTASQPLSATSSTFGSALPLPFALPHSTSTYFFKQPGGIASNNNSTTSLLVPEQEDELSIPSDLKDIVNSDDSIDFFISPTSPKTLRVSRWKQKYGKWEMITTNENLFVKIVTNYLLHKSWLLVFKEEHDEEYGEVVDKPVLMLNIDNTAKVRQSSALDLEINSINSITNERMLVIARCYKSALLTSLKMNLENIIAVMNSEPSLMKSATFESNNTLASSYMSTKPSASSTLTSIYTTLQDAKQTPCSTAPSVPNDEVLHDGELVLLDRATIRLHKQQESYEEIHRLSSWKTIDMYTLSIYHSTNSFDKSSYHLKLDCQDAGMEDELNHLEFSFDDSAIFNFIERIGKAALLLKVTNEEIYMLECKGKKEFKRLYELF